MAAPTARHVEQTAAPDVNNRIRRQALINVSFCANNPEMIDERLRELDEEIDIDRALGVSSASLSLLGVGMSILRGRHWLVVPAVVQGFFLQHAVQGWSPPLDLLRRLGFRTRIEIEDERNALRALRGDYTELAEIGRGREEGGGGARTSRQTGQGARSRRAEQEHAGERPGESESSPGRSESRRQSE